MPRYLVSGLAIVGRSINAEGPEQAEAVFKDSNFSDLIFCDLITSDITEEIEEPVRAGIILRVLSKLKAVTK